MTASPACRPTPTPGSTHADLLRPARPGWREASAWWSTVYPRAVAGADGPRVASCARPLPRAHRAPACWAEADGRAANVAVGRARPPASIRRHRDSRRPRGFGLAPLPRSGPIAAAWAVLSIGHTSCPGARATATPPGRPSHRPWTRSARPAGARNPPGGLAGVPHLYAGRAARRASRRFLGSARRARCSPAPRRRAAAARACNLWSWRRTSCARRCRSTRRGAPLPARVEALNARVGGRPATLPLSIASPSGRACWWTVTWTRASAARTA